MNLEDAAIAAMEEMTEAGLPVESFEPCGEGYDFVFSRGLTEAEQRQAKHIAATNIWTTWHFHAPARRAEGKDE